MNIAYTVHVCVIVVTVLCRIILFLKNFHADFFLSNENVRLVIFGHFMRKASCSSTVHGNASISVLVITTTIPIRIATFI